MRLAIGWAWPRGTPLQYCLKVAAASLLGYLLSLGGTMYAVYGAFSAALIVGASRGTRWARSAAEARRAPRAGLVPAPAGALDSA